MKLTQRSFKDLLLVRMYFDGVVEVAEVRTDRRERLKLEAKEVWKASQVFVISARQRTVSRYREVRIPMILSGVVNPACCIAEVVAYAFVVVSMG
jgi:hypothetical protein